MVRGDFPASSPLCGDFDVVVIGGGLAGICAAIAASRLGSAVALVHDRPVLGGNASSEMRVGISGADVSGGALARYARETGIIGELAIESMYRNPDFGSSFHLQDTIFWEWVRREPNLTLFLNAQAQEAVMTDDRTIGGITVIQISTEKSFSLKGKVVVDCSGDGRIAADAGAEYRMGREARSEFGEVLARDSADGEVMSSTLNFSVKDVGRRIEFIAPPWARIFPSDDDLPFRDHAIPPGEFFGGFWWLAYGGMRDTIEDNEEIRDELLRVLFGMWDHLKNRGDHGLANMTLDWIGPIPAKRESRRFVGDYILTENDIRNHTLFPDRVAYGGWPIDIHPPEGIYSREPPNISVPLPELYSIPFRSLYSRNIHNLLIAGRNISVTHVALGSTRVMATCALLGQAAGTAAHICAERGIAPRELYERHMAELQQQLLKDDCYIIGLRNEDPADLARAATASASSEESLRTLRMDGVEHLDAPRAQLFPVSEDRISSISLLLESGLGSGQELRLGLRRAEHVNDLTSAEDMAEANSKVPTGRSWVDFNLDLAVKPDLYWIWLPEAKGIGWYYLTEAPVGTNRAIFREDHRPRWVSRSGSFLFRPSPPSQPYRAANVINGVARPEHWPNVWISDPTRSLPQHLDLDLHSNCRIDTVHLTFDAALDTNIYLPPPWGAFGTEHVLPQIVRDYALYWCDGEEWRCLLQERGNHHRMRVHHFGPISTSKLRLEVQATNGDRSARVYEIRIYNEDG
jgi:hypothetical protein